MELMVYIALLGVIVLVAGQVFSDSTKFRIRSESMIKANAVASDIATLMLEDVGQTGAKSSKESGETIVVADSLYMDPLNATANKNDSSSFRISKGCANCDTDSLVVRRIRYAETGNFAAVEEISWFKNGSKLYRACRTVPNTSSTPSVDCPAAAKFSEVAPVEMADNIDHFKVIPAKPRVESTDAAAAGDRSYLLPNTDPTVKNFRLVPRYGENDFFFVSVEPANGGESVALSGFAANYDFDANEPITDGKKANQVFVAASNTASGNWKDLCKKVTLEPQIEYEISFSIPYRDDNSRMFCPGRDFAAVGFRKQDGSKFEELDDFNFFLPAASTENPVRKFRFSVKTRIENVCMAFTFASYSPVVATGSLTLQNVSLKKVETSNFNFDDENFSPRTEDKKNVKAFLVTLSAKRNGEVSESRQIVPIPSNGPRD